jgi:hypothetical protein
MSKDPGGRHEESQSPLPFEPTLGLSVPKTLNGIVVC